MTWKPIVGKRFSPDEFEDYVKSLQFTNWRPSFCVLHNTSVPSLTQRPRGFTAQHMQNLAGYYRDDQHWSSGPHLFIDDNGIWVFTPLTTPGTHSPSWNSVSWGIEQLGEFETEGYDTGRGAKVRDNAVAALASLHAVIGLDSSTLRFHKEDVRTTHRECPGRHCVKSDVIQRVHNLIIARHSGEHKPVAVR